MGTNYLSKSASNVVTLVSKEVPKVWLSTQAFGKIRSIVAQCDKEVGWLGIVDKIENNYLISDVYLVKQEVTSSTTELDEDAVGLLAHEILSEEKGAEKLNKLRFWGHSHVNMGVTPSVQDTRQLEEFLDDVDDFFLKGIFNKKGDIYFSLVNKAKGIKVAYLEWDIYVENQAEISEQIKKEIEEKVEEKKYNYESYSPYNRKTYNDNKVVKPLDVTNGQICPICRKGRIYYDTIGEPYCTDWYCDYNYDDEYTNYLPKKEREEIASIAKKEDKKTSERLTDNNEIGSFEEIETLEKLEDI